MSSVLLDLGFIKIYWYSVIMLTSILIGGFLAIREAKKRGIEENVMIDLFFYMFIFAIVGARLYFVIFNLDYYLSNPIDILKVWEGGLAIHGAIIGGLGYAIYFTIKRKINTFKLLDILAVSLFVGQIIGRWGNFFNGEAHGPVTTLSFLQKIIPFNFIIEGMHIDGVYYHPTFLYESLWCLLGLIIILILRHMKNIKIGQLTGFYFMWYSFGRFFIEGLRTDSLMFLNIRVAQLISIVLFIAGLVLFIWRGNKKNNYYNEENK